MKSFAVATEGSAAGAANRALKEMGSATDAVLAGFIAAAAERAGALLAPVQILVAGPGVGARAFDGRARQPGLGSPRPRGYRAGDPVPPAARVPVPASLVALSLAHAYDGSLSFERIARPAVELARGAGAPHRAEVIARVAAVASVALREPAIARPLLAVAARAFGGLLSEEDFVALRPQSEEPRAVAAGDGRAALVVPWEAPERAERAQEIVAAGDARGVLAVLSYAPDDDGIKIPELELAIPGDAVVVRRGIPRARPGEPIPCPAPIAIGALRGAALVALGVAARAELNPARLAEGWSEGPWTAAAMLRAAVRAAGGGRGVAVVRSADHRDVTGLALAADAAEPTLDGGDGPSS